MTHDINKHASNSSEKNVESVLSDEVVEKLSYTDAYGMMKKTDICIFGLLLYTQ